MAAFAPPPRGHPIVTGITLALSKGRIFEETLPLLAAAGVVPSDDPDKSRKLIIGTNRPDVRIVIVRATDAPTYVQYGAPTWASRQGRAVEHGGAGLYQPWTCDRALPHERGGAGGGLCGGGESGARLRVATKYIQTPASTSPPRGAS